VPLFLGSLVPNPWLAALLMAMVAFWFYNTIPPVLVATSRAIFAMSFDRALPKQFADVNRRGVPTWATHAAMIFGLVAILVFARNVTLIVAMLDITTLFIFWMFGLSALMLPFRRPDIYALSPVQREVLGVPLVSLLGLLTTAVGWFFVLFAAAPLKAGAQVGLCVLILLMYAVYVRCQQQARREGIDVSAIYGEIPPE
jgi:amino acid transporter